MSSSMASLAQTIEQSWLAQTVKHSYWIYPSLESIHILGIAVLVGSVVLMDLRILGVSKKQLSLESLSWLATRVGFFGLSLAAATGLCMLAAQASSLISSTPFQVKLVLILGLLINALFAQRIYRRQLVERESCADIPATLSTGLKIQALASIVGWVTVVAIGRWTAYV